MDIRPTWATMSDLPHGVCQIRLGAEKRKTKIQNKGHNLEALCVFSVVLFHLYPEDLDCSPYIAAVNLLSSLGSSLSTTSDSQFPKETRLACMCFLCPLPSPHLWVFLPFPTDLEPNGQFQRQLMEDQKSQSCPGSCQPHEHECLGVAAGNHSRRGSRRIFPSAWVMEGLSCCFQSGADSWETKFLWPSLAPVNKSVWKRAARLSGTIDACRNSQTFFSDWLKFSFCCH